MGRHPGSDDAVGSRAFGARIARRSLFRAAGWLPLLLAGCAVSAGGLTHRKGSKAAGPALATSSALPTSTRLTIRADALFKARTALVAAWQRAHPGVTLSILPSYSGSPSPGQPYTDAMQRSADILAIGGDGEVMGGSGDWPDLSALVKQQNFDLSILSGGAVGAFSGGGRMWGLPVRMVPFAMTVDAKAIRRLGVGPATGAPWTWADLQDAVAAALATSGRPPGPVLSGTGWADIRVLGAFIVGFGGSLTRGGALALDSSQAVAAAAPLVDFAHATGWPPVTGWQFPGHPFDPTPAPQPTASGHPGAPLFLVEPLLNGFSSAPLPSAVRFPVLPQQDVVPVARVDGLGLSHYCLHPEVACAFMLWLYQPEQQTALIGAGVPPIVSDAGLQAAWVRAASAHPTALAPYAPQHMVDIASLVPAIAGGTASNYTRLMAPAMFDLATHPEGLAQALKAAQQAVEPAIHPAVAGSVCDATDPLCGAAAP